MAAALGGTLWFCKTLFLMAGDIFGVAQFRAETEAVSPLPDGVSAWKIYGPVLLVSAAVVVGSWISGIRYGRAAVRGEARG